MISRIVGYGTAHTPKRTSLTKYNEGDTVILPKAHGRSDDVLRRAVVIEIRQHYIRCRTGSGNVECLNLHSGEA